MNEKFEEKIRRGRLLTEIELLKARLAEIETSRSKIVMLLNDHGGELDLEDLPFYLGRIEGLVKR